MTSIDTMFWSIQFDIKAFSQKHLLVIFNVFIKALELPGLKYAEANQDNNTQQEWVDAS